MSATKLSARIEDIKGQVFGRLTVVRYAGKNKHRAALWECVCTCGTIKVVLGRSLVTGGVRSCSCLRDEAATSHGHSGGRWGKPVPEYDIWAGMLARCNNSKHHAWPRYGGRGIRACERWHSYEAFYTDMGPRPTPEHTLDRIDNDGNYEPGNCRWATKKQQSRNRRNTRYLTFNGETCCASEWAEKLGIPYQALLARLRKWTVERALTEKYKPCSSGR